MNDDPVIKEIEATDRWLWKEGGETVEGLFALCHRLSEQALAEYDQYGDGWRGLGRAISPGAEAMKRQAPCDTVCVCEGAAPEYGAGKTSDLARKGGEGV